MCGSARVDLFCPRGRCVEDLKAQTCVECLGRPIVRDRCKPTALAALLPQSPQRPRYEIAAEAAPTLRFRHMQPVNISPAARFGMVRIVRHRHVETNTGLLIAGHRAYGQVSIPCALNQRDAGRRRQGRGWKVWRSTFEVEFAVGRCESVTREHARDGWHLVGQAIPTGIVGRHGTVAIFRWKCYDPLGTLRPREARRDQQGDSCFVRCEETRDLQLGHIVPARRDRTEHHNALRRAVIFGHQEAVASLFRPGQRLAGIRLAGDKPAMGYVCRRLTIEGVETRQVCGLVGHNLHVGFLGIVLRHRAGAPQKSEITPWRVQGRA